MIKFKDLQNLLEIESAFRRGPVYSQNPANPKTVSNIPKTTRGNLDQVKERIGHLLDENGKVPHHAIPEAERLIGRIPATHREWKYSDEYETVRRDAGNPAYLK